MPVSHQEVVVSCERLLETDHWEYEDIIALLQEARDPYLLAHRKRIEIKLPSGEVARE